MPRRTGGAMHVVTTRRRYKDREYETHLLRRTFRQNGAVRNETLANLSHLPKEAIDAVKRVLHGETLVGAHDAFEITRSLPHGDAAALWQLAHSIGLPALLGPACRQRDLALALICSQVLEPSSEAAYATCWEDRTLGVDLGIAGVHTDELYEAMDWLYERKDTIEAALVNKHLGEGALVCYDLSSSWVEGSCNELAAFGHSRDQKRAKRQIEYGVVATREGLACAIEVFSGNTADPKSFETVVEKLRERFGFKVIIFVGDRKMVTRARIKALEDIGGAGWLSALRAPEIKALVNDGAIQQSLFDEVNFAEITHPDYEGERLVVCRNPFLAAERARKREALLLATEADLEKVRASVAAGRLEDAGKIGLRAGRVLNRHKMAKHFELTIEEGRFSFARKADAIAAEAALDGIYVISTSVGADALASAEVVTTYKSLSNLERECFRHIQTVDVEIRPIRHRLADRVRCHAFICMLAVHLVFHLRRAWAPLTFKDEEPPLRQDPVAPARRSRAAATKAARRAQPTGSELRPFQGLLDHLATLTRNTCRVPGTEVTFEQLAEPTPTQRKAFELLGVSIPRRIA
ncbi:MAG: IS1634 family transposase [Actinomycetota bacterium]|nr:IS1634 family transposase [Actinomycetota bacterium]